LDSLRSAQVGAGVTRVRIGRDALPRDEYLDAFSHMTRVVQSEPLSDPQRIWSNRGMTTYRERLWAAWWMYLATALVIPAALLVFLPINPVAGAVVAGVLYVGCVAMLIAAAPVISVDDGTLIAG